MNTAAMRTLLAALLVLMACPADSAARDLTACVGIIPPHAEIGSDGRPTGGFVEVIKAIDRVSPEIHISIKALPIARAISYLLNGRGDFLAPYIPNPHVSPEALPFAFAAEPIVDVSFVLYTHAGRPLLDVENLASFRIETLRGAALHFPFRISEIDSFEQGVLKVLKGRSDGFIAEQDATDKYIRENRIKPIRRTLYAVWQSSILIPKGPEGIEIDRIVSDALRQLKKSGELQKITETIHRPFSDWQPYEMDW